jgi:cob(I)alamin adenosyltransferase
MKIYTRTGDTGRTALFGGGRVPKHHLRVEAYGMVDELNAHLGRTIVALEDAELRARLELLQHDLFGLGASLASPRSPAGERHPHLPPLPLHRIAVMEGWMDGADEELPPLRAFVLPGGSPGAAELHVARTVCRRAERRVVELMDAEGADGEVDPDTVAILRYLNRLSDLLFTLARLENHRTGRGDVPWRKEAAEGGAEGDAEGPARAGGPEGAGGEEAAGAGGAG